MSSTVQLTAIHGENGGEPMCFLLELDECRILLDCGWDHSFDPEALSTLRQLATEIDFVLISHPDVSHLGALPYAVGKLGMDCPVYATLPVYRLGQLAMYEVFQSRSSREAFSVWDLDDVDQAFDRVVPLKYSQEVQLSGRGTGITVTPYCAGHSLGGAIWKIQKETDEIAYAVEFNHRREAHLNGTVIEAAFTKPSVLITDVRYPIDAVHEPRKDRDDKFFGIILNTLQNQNNVLIPVDGPGSRTLEILYLLNHFWEHKKLASKFSLILLSHMGYHILEYGKGFIEWMSSKFQNQFNQTRDNPFNLRSVRTCYDLEDLDSYLDQGPAVVLATLSVLDCSFGEDLLLRWAADSNCTIIFPYLPEPKSLAAQIIEKSQQPDRSQFQFSHLRKFKVPLEGQELIQYYEEKRLEEDAARKEEEDSDSDNDDEMEIEVSRFSDGMNGSGETNVPVSMFKRRVKLTPAFAMFGSKENVTQWDEYGEIIKIEDYLDDGKRNSMDIDIGGSIVLDEKEVLSESKPATASVPPDGNTDVPMAEATEKLPEEVPSKELSEVVTFHVDCNIIVIDFEGRVDARSLRTILRQVSPRKLVLVRGDETHKLDMQDYCLKNICNSVLLARNNKTLNLTSDTSTFKVKLRESLAKTLDLVRVSGGQSGDLYEVAYLDGRVSLGGSDFGLPVLKEVAEEEVKGHPAVFLGDVKLPDVRRTLLKNGFDAEFVGGTLVCNEGSVNIRKVGDNTLSVRGSLCEEYFRIRELLYSHYQIV